MIHKKHSLFKKLADSAIILLFPWCFDWNMVFFLNGCFFFSLCAFVKYKFAMYFLSELLSANLCFCFNSSMAWKSVKRPRLRQQLPKKSLQRAAWLDLRRLCQLAVVMRRRKKASWTQWWNTCQAHCKTCSRSKLGS